MNNNITGFSKKEIFENKVLSWIIDNITDEKGTSVLKQLNIDFFDSLTNKEIFLFVDVCLNNGVPIDFDNFKDYIYSYNKNINIATAESIFTKSLWKNNGNTEFDIDVYVKYLKSEYAKKILAEKAISIHMEASSGRKNVKELAQKIDILKEEFANHSDDDDDGELMSVGEEHENYKQEIRDDYERSKNGLLKTKTQIGDFDKITGGFSNGDLIILGARPSMGKTSLAISMLYGMLNSKQEGVFVFFSAEVHPKKIKAKLTAIHANLPAKLFTDFIDFEEHLDLVEESIDVLHKEIAKNRLYILDANNKSIAYIKNSLRKIYKKHGRIDGVFLDYLQFVKTENRNDKRIEIGEISRETKRLALKYDMPFVALSQLNRNLEQRDDKRPIPADLKDSGDIEQDADLIVFIYRDEVYNKKKKDEIAPGHIIEETSQSKISIAELIIAKNRNGPTGTAWASFNKETTRFSTATLQDELESLKTIDIDQNIKGNLPKQEEPQVFKLSQGIKPKTQTVFDIALAGGGTLEVNEDFSNFISLDKGE